MLKQSKKIILTQKFFSRPAPEVARELLGKFLIRKVAGKEIFSLITETEAYEGTEDLACHAAKGKTQRTEIMFGPPGFLYIYLIYGMYFMLNIVTSAEGQPSAVLIRGTELISGPGRLTKNFLIDQSLNKLKADKKSGLWFEDRGVVVCDQEIKDSARIGVDYAGPVWSQKPWRFYLAKGKGLEKD